MPQPARARQPPSRNASQSPRAWARVSSSSRTRPANRPGRAAGAVCDTPRSRGTRSARVPPGSSARTHNRQACSQGSGPNQRTGSAAPPKSSRMSLGGASASGRSHQAARRPGSREASEVQGPTAGESRHTRKEPGRPDRRCTSAAASPQWRWIRLSHEAMGLSGMETPKHTTRVNSSGHCFPGVAPQQSLSGQRRRPGAPAPWPEPVPGRPTGPRGPQDRRRGA